MNNRETAPTRPAGRLTGKRQAILDAALGIFARDGYSRAGIDAIASAAGVSTRTIYNHFQDKAELFQVVIQDSAARVADAQIALIDRHLGDPIDATNLEAALVRFGQTWIAPMPDYADHFQLVRQINADAGHIPPAAIDAWQRTGPRRVLRELAHRLRQLADRGLVRLDNPERAALHFGLLVSVTNPSYRHAAPSEKEAAEMVTAGVRTFLHGHLP
jgi:AcrR family transcriptional regulator